MLSRRSLPAIGGSVHTRLQIVLTALALLAAASVPARAAASACDAVTGNLVLNCGFEADPDGTAHPSNWVTDAGWNLHAGSFNRVWSANVNSGTRSTNFGNYESESPAGISQSLSTVPGQTYRVTFYATGTGSFNTGDANSLLQAFVDGASKLMVPGTSITTTTQYVSFQFTFVGTGSNTLKFQANTNGGEWNIDDVNVVAIPPIVPTVKLNRSVLNYGYSGSLITSPQQVLVTFPAAGSAWTAVSNQSNITVSSNSGTGNGSFTVTAAAGASGAVTVTAPAAGNSPQLVQINVASTTPAPPGGSFDTPVNNTTGIAGAIPVTGWAVDSIEVTKVDVWREPLTGEATQPNGLVYIGDAVFVADARPDVEAAMPAAPFQYRAGWGYLMLTNFLPNSSGSGALGNGTYKLHVIAHNKSGMSTDLGARTITVDNAHASKPFGTIDTPTQGGTASGAQYVNFGWALTQNPYMIPTDGSTILVYLDGVAQPGHPTYNNHRDDIATLFPGYANSNGAVGYYLINSTQLTNGVHTISWVVSDNGSRADGIGSRYFTVFNAGGSVSAAPEPPAEESLRAGVRLRRGFDSQAQPQALNADGDGGYTIDVEELSHLELTLGAAQGHMQVGDGTADLPLGSTLSHGVFWWDVPVAFVGEYRLVFERAQGEQVRVRVRVLPKRFE